MSSVTRIAWSGLTGKTGQEAMKQVSLVDGVKIVMGMKRELSGADDVNVNGGVTWAKYESGMNGLFGLVNVMRLTGANAMVDFSHESVLERVIELAVRTHVPLISGTSGLSGRQMAMLHSAATQIPVFRGGNFRFKVKKFIDEAVELALKEKDAALILQERAWRGANFPTEAAKTLRRRLGKAAGRSLAIYSHGEYAPGNWINDWEFQVCRDESETERSMEKLSCRTIGFDELAHDVLEIAKVMAKKPAKKDGSFYDLDEIWDEIPVEAKAIS